MAVGHSILYFVSISMLCHFLVFEKDYINYHHMSFRNLLLGFQHISEKINKSADANSIRVLSGCEIEATGLQA